MCCLSQVQGISIESLVQIEKIVTDIYKMLQQICSQGMVKGLWYFFFFILFQGTEIDFQTVKCLALWTVFKNRLECQKINISLIFNHCAYADSSIHMRGCNPKCYGT